MMMEFTIAAALAAAQAGAGPAPINPHAANLFERDPALRAWAVRSFDSNRDGWLTLYEAQPALARLKAIADMDGDGRVTVREFEQARSIVAAEAVDGPTVVSFR